MGFSVHKILVPTDFSAGARAAADAAVELARKFGASLTVVHVLPLTSSLAAATALDGTAPEVFQFEKALHRHADRDLHAEAARLSATGVAVEHRTLEGQAPTTIAEEATRAGCDLIVIGSHGRSGLERLALGSVAERVVRLAHVPVLTVRSPPAG